VFIPKPFKELATNFKMMQLVNFVNTGDPNTPKNPASLLSKVDWQPWGSSAANPPLLTFLDPAPTVMITFDTYRADAMKILTNISLAVASGLN
jgi:acetylcholinesterase